MRRGDADAMLCGLVGRYDAHLEHVRDVIGLQPGVPSFAAMNALMLETHTLFITDTFVNDEPERRAAGRDRRDGRRRGAPLRPAAQGGLRVALDVRLAQAAVGATMRAARELFRKLRARRRVRRRDARRRRAVGGRSATLPARQRADRRGQPAGAAQPGRRQHPVQRAQDDRRPRRHGRPDPARRGAAGAHPDAVGRPCAGSST